MILRKETITVKSLVVKNFVITSNTTAARDEEYVASSGD